MNIDFSKYSFLIFLGLLIAQPVFAQNESIDDCAAEIDNDPDTPVDIDDDNDGLIEICYLEDLNAIRFVLDGSGYQNSAVATTNTTGCPNTGCNGYELVRDLDFSNAQSYVSGVVNSGWVLSNVDFLDTTKQGWDPIGGTFSGIFEGNGYSISSLQINRDGTNDIGMFAGNTGTIRNLGLREIEVEGNTRVGGLVGRNEGNLINVYVDQGGVEGEANNAGLLAGVSGSNGLIINSYVRGTVLGSRWVGGICGINRGTIINSYANAKVTGLREAGGLVGESQGTISNSYTMGSAHITSIDDENRRSVGGLLAVLWTNNDPNVNPSITNSYSTVAVTADSSANNIGGLIGNRRLSNLPVTDSYWDTDTSGQVNSPGGGTAQTTVELQTPTNADAATGIYANWSITDWDFGSTQTYAALRYAEGDDSNNPACDVNPDTPLPPCGALLSGQAIRNKGLSILFLVVDGEQQDNTEIFRNRPFSPVVFDYDINISRAITRIQLRPYSIHNTATISIVKSGENTDYFSEKNSGDLSNLIPLQAGINETLRVMAEGVTYNFNLIKGPQNPVGIAFFGTIPPTATVSEGDDIMFRAVFDNGSGNYEYSLQQGDTVLDQGQGTNAIVTFTVPDTFLDVGETMQSIVYTITVDDGFDIASAELVLTVNKVDNGEPQLELTVSPTLLSITSNADDPDGIGTFTYQWQSRDEGHNSWTDLSATNRYTVSGTPPSTIRYRVVVNHTDGQGYNKEYTLGPFPIDVDGDDDGLIDIRYLEDLDVLRYQADGSGYRINPGSDNITVDKIVLGCPADTCTGYELLRDLDFNADDSYADATSNKSEWTVDDSTDDTDTGWLPIATVAAPFAGTFNGNNNNIFNLQINRDMVDDAYIGLFAASSLEARIENIGILDVEIEGRGSVGSLVAQNEGVITNSYAQGEVKGSQHSVGGLVAFNHSSATSVIVNSYADVTVMSTGALLSAGLVGNNHGKIRNSYAAGNVSGACDVGGLVAENGSGSDIVNSYAAGSVNRSGDCTEDITRNRAGGLVADNAGLIRNSYAYGLIDGGGGTVGGLVATGTTGMIESSYWDSTVNSGITTNIEAKTRTELQTPTNENAATGIYTNWRVADWDFGSSTQYPILRYTSPTDISIAPVCDDDLDTALPPCGGVLLDQAEKGLSNLLFFVDSRPETANKPFSLSIFSDYTINVVNKTMIELLPYSINPQGASISILKTGDSTDYFMGKRSGELSMPIPLSEGVSILTIVVGNDPTDTNPVTYSVTVNNPISAIEITSIIGADTVDEGDPVNLTATITGGDSDIYSYRWTSEPETLLAGETVTNANLSFNAPIRFVPRDDTDRDVVIKLIVGDGFVETSATKTLTIRKVDSGEPSFTVTVTVSMISIEAIVEGSDPDGDGMIDSYAWQRRGAGDTDWITIPGETSATYIIPTQDTSDSLYRAQVVSIDGQGNHFTSVVGPYRNRTDIDDDDDGLIDIYYLEDLHAVRYQTDGSGYRASEGATKSTAGCMLVGGTETCSGYELRRDLDFTIAENYINAMTNRAMWTVDNFDTAGDTGWQPIGSITNNGCSDSSSRCFAGIFEGNGHSISNLHINRDTVDDAYIGLFAASSVEARIENIGILDVDIEGRGSVGSLVAQNEGVITNSYAQGEVKGSQHSVGGLVAFNHSFATSVIVNSYADVMVMSTGALLSAGLVGNNHGKIRNSYAAGNVSGACDVGGLVAENGSGSDIVNSYAAGSVNRSGGCTEDSTRNRAGGLVADNAGLIRNSYAYGLIDGGGGTVGGLVATGTTGMIESSYWDSTVNSGITTNIEAKTRTELQTPTNENAATGIYTNWRIADWDFGSSTQYPILRYTSPTDISIAPVCDDDLDTALPPCGGVLLDQGEKGLSNLLFFVDSRPETANKPFSLSIFSDYTINVVNKTMIELLPYSINPQGASISILKTGDSTDYFTGKRSGELSMPIPLSEGVSILTIVVGNDPTDTNPVTYSVTVNNPISAIEITSIIGADTVDEGDPVNLTATITGGDSDIYRYRWTSEPETLLAGETVTNANLSFNAPIRFVPRDDTDRDVVIKLIVGDGFVETSATKTLTIRKVDNGGPGFTTTVTISMISIEAIVEGSDPDGDGTIDSYAWQRRGAGDTDWTTIPGETSATYIIPTQDTSDSLYRAQVVSIDGQGNRFTSVVGPYRNRTDIDDDDDGLIDIYYLEDLHAVRYQTDGSGYRASGGPTKSAAGCMLVGGMETCMGYELRRDLDFTIAENYINAMTNRAMWTVDNFDTDGDTGWNPIGSVAGNNCSDPSSRCFAGIFEGNGYGIFNLQINRDGTNEIGMFAGNSNTGTIRNLGLREIEVEGNNRVGGLVGRNEGNLINTHVIESRVEGKANNAGLLVGVSGSNGLIINSYVRGTVVGFRWVGGICGVNGGRIINSYANARGTGLREAGGLVGENQGSISNSYARGSVHITASNSPSRAVGGLLAVLWTGNNPSVTNNYSTVRVTADSSNNNIGGLIGNRHESNPPVTDSYWDINTSNQTASPGGGTAQTTVGLQTPTNDNAATGIYANWSTDDWDFGTTEQYPALLYNEIAGVDACDDDAATPLPRCGSLLPGQNNAKPEIISPRDGDEILLAADTNTTLSVVVSDGNINDELTVKLDALDGEGNIVASFTISGTPTGNVQRMLDLTIRVPTPDAMLVKNFRLVAEDNSGFNNAKSDEVLLNVGLEESSEPIITITPPTVPTMQLNDMTDIVVSVADNDFDEGDSVTLTAESSSRTIVSVAPEQTDNITTDTSITFTLTAEQSGEAVITFTATDSNGLKNSETVPVRVNVPPTITSFDDTVSVKEGREQTIAVSVSDADTDDSLTLSLTAMNENQDIVELVTTSVAVMTNGSVTRDAQTLRIKGLKAGMATLNITISDEHTESASVSVSVTVERNTAPTITGVPTKPIGLLEGAETMLDITIDDTDTDDLPTGLRLSVRSDDTDVASVTTEGNNTTRTIKIAGKRVGMATITMTVDDDRGATNSVVPERLMVEVEANEAPTLGIITSPGQAIEPESTARVVVSVADNNFDLDDRVTLTAESSSRTIVSVTPKQIDNITTDTNITFTLTAEQSGAAVITFTATDSKNNSTNTKIVVRTNTPPQVSSVPTSVVATVGEAFRLETGSFFSDADNDALTYSIVVDPDNLSYNFSTTGTLTFTPTNAEASTNTTGFTVTVSAADDTGGTAQAVFALLIDAQPTGSVMISRNSTNQWQLEGDPTGISDANGIARRTYRWYRNNSIIGGATGNSYTIPGNGRTAGTRYRLDVTIVDNIGQSATVQSDAITIDNIAPIIRGITITVDPPSPPLEEGDEVTITADATDENNDSLTYSWRVTSGHDGINVSSINARQVSFTLPDYLIKSSTLTQQTLALQLVVRDTAAEAVSTMVSVVVNKKDNGQANIGTLSRDNDNERILTLTGLTLTDDPDGGGLSSTVAYQWQRCWGSDGTDCSDANNWVNISGATGNSYTIPASLSGHTIAEGDLFRIGVTYTDMQGYERTVYSGSRGVSRSTEIRIRARVFLEGPIQ